MLRKHWKLSSVVVVVLAGLTLSIGALAGRQNAEAEKKTSLDQVPEAVKATLLSQEDQGKEDEDETPLSIDQVPAPVKATLLREAQGGTIKEIQREAEDGQTVYGAEVVINGQEFDLKIAPDTGKLISKEAEDENEEKSQEK
jgi:uncharacterized membrane protein YkoI